LRAPLASILGLVTLFERVNLKEEDKLTLAHLKQSAINLDIIIRAVMESIEKADHIDDNNNMEAPMELKGEVK
jgi:hypothetical protein